MFSVVVVPHWPALGVNVYVLVPAVAVLMVDGDQVPEIPLVEVAGSVGAVAPWHKGPMAAKVGVTGAVTVIVTASTDVQPLASEAFRIAV